jgi:hypothetical protein
MGPAYLRELEGVVYRYAGAALGTTTTTTTTGILPNPSKSKSKSSHIPQVIAPNDDDNGPNSTPTTGTKEPPPIIALLVSESAFTRHCLLAAHASPLPSLLVHIPPPPPPPPHLNPSRNSGSAGVSVGVGVGGSAIGAIFGNPALVSAKGLLGGETEIRWERGGSGVPSSGMLGGAGAGRPRLWWQGQPLPSWTPESSADVDGDGAVL